MDTHTTSTNLPYVLLEITGDEPSATETKNVDVTQMPLGGVLTM